MRLGITIYDLRFARLEASGRGMRVGSQAEGLDYSSPGQRPRNDVKQSSFALKGQSNESIGGPRFGVPFQGVYNSLSGPEGVALGYYGNALSARQTAFRGAFTLVELLTVIAIIGILAATLLVVVNRVIVHAKMTQTRLEVSQISNAISEYDSLYGHMPVPDAVQKSGSNYVTYGGTYNSTAAAGSQFPPPVATAGWGPSPFGYSSPVGLYVTSNSDVMAVLLDLTNYPSTTIPTINVGHQKNPMRKILLSARFAGDSASPGVGTDLNFRDAWGNLILISMVLNGDNQCADPFYAPAAMSSSTGFVGGSGADGLSCQPGGNYMFQGNVMVWSMGPDGPIDHSPSSFTYSPSTPASSGAWAQDSSNKKHILSWAQ